MSVSPAGTIPDADAGYIHAVIIRVFFIYHSIDLIRKPVMLGK